MEHEDKMILEHIQRMTRNEEQIKTLQKKQDDLDREIKNIDKIVRKLQIKIAVWSSVGAGIGSTISIFINHFF